METVGERELLERRLREAEGELDAMAQELLDRYEELTVLYDLTAALGGVFDVAAQCDVAADRATRAVRARSCEVLLDRAPAPGPPVLSTDAGATLTVPVEGAGADGRQEVLGALVLVGDAFDAGHVKLATAVGRQLGTALQTARMVTSLKEAAGLEHELGLAADIQRSLLPASPPVVKGTDLAGLCRPASRVGGDYFDFVVDHTGALSVVIADVTGHSVGSALMMAMARSLLRRDLTAGRGPAEVLAAANRALFDDLVGAGLFITAFATRYDPARRSLRFTNGAHNPGLLCRVDAPTVELLDSDGMAIGMLEDPPYGTGSVVLEPGDLVVLHTDGITEARNGGGELFGEERLYAVVRRLAGRPAAEVVAGIDAAVQAHAAGEPQQDDVTVVALAVIE
jgi:serine phosphatase RsbU (regulator of sigma subunit)